MFFNHWFDHLFLCTNALYARTVGDEGFRQFLLMLSRNSQKLLLEPQPYKCYKSAKKRMNRLKIKKPGHFASIVWRKDVVEKIEEFLMRNEDSPFQKVSIFGETEW